MTRGVQIIGPDETIQQAARTMCEIDAGTLPVADEERLLGMITDRDIAIRAVARGLGPDCLVAEVMSPEVLYCFADEDVDEVLRNMGDIKVRRLPVLNRDKRLVGIVSLSDMTTGGARPPAAEALHQIAAPGGPHSQTLH
jgi:CBS domain-containing protein